VVIDSSGPHITGIKRFVIDGQLADLIVVIAAVDGEPAVFAVDAHDPSVEAATTTAFDFTRRLADVEFRSTPARQLGGADLAARLLDLACVLLAAEQTGGAQAALDMAVDYAKTRVQFGRTIGSFQAIKHMCADMLLEVESARSAAYYAAWAIADDADDAQTAAPLAKAYCSDTFLAAASMNMQVHGGISFTWEHPAHLYYRRAKSGVQLWGTPQAHRELLVSRLGL
jgi:alkylation response protein AidB-like acyl-CoA dehydrogenase